jgi:hypothetical protein
MGKSETDLPQYVQALRKATARLGSPLDWILVQTADKVAAIKDYNPTPDWKEVE